MALYKLGFMAATMTAYVALSPEDLPVGAIDMGTFEDEPDDSNVFYHHVRDVLCQRSWEDPSETASFPHNITDMSRITIMYQGEAIVAQSVTASAIEVVGTASDTIELIYKPSGETADNAHFTFESNDEAVATVDAAGEVTGVAAGTTTITATHTNGGMSVEIQVTVTEAG